MILALLVLIDVNAQRTPTQVVENVKTADAVQIIEAAAKSLNYRLAQFDRANKIITTDWIEWTSIAIRNRAKIKFVANANQVTITMIDRSYKTKDGWAKSPTNLSKRNKKKYLGTLATKIAAIATNLKLSEQAVYNSVLIRKFKKTITINGLEWRFLKGERDVEMEKANIPNYVIRLSVTNTQNKAILVKVSGQNSALWPNQEKNNHGSITHYSAVKFGNQLNNGASNKKLEPNETAHLLVYFSNINTKLADKPVGLFRMSYRVFNENTQKHTKYQIENYNIPFPFENEFK